MSGSRSLIRALTPSAGRLGVAPVRALLSRTSPPVVRGRAGGGNGRVGRSTPHTTSTKFVDVPHHRCSMTLACRDPDPMRTVPRFSGFRSQKSIYSPFAGDWSCGLTRADAQKLYSAARMRSLQWAAVAMALSQHGACDARALSRPFVPEGRSDRAVACLHYGVCDCGAASV